MFADCEFRGIHLHHLWWDHAFPFSYGFEYSPSSPGWALVEPIHGHDFLHITQHGRVRLSHLMLLKGGHTTWMQSHLGFWFPKQLLFSITSSVSFSQVSSSSSSSASSALALARLPNLWWMKRSLSLSGRQRPWERPWEGGGGLSLLVVGPPVSPSPPGPSVVVVGSASTPSSCHTHLPFDWSLPLPPHQVSLLSHDWDS